MLVWLLLGKGGVGRLGENAVLFGEFVLQVRVFAEAVARPSVGPCVGPA